VLVVFSFFVIIAAVIHFAPPGKNYLDRDYWRSSHYLSTEKLQDLRQRFPLHIDTNNTDEMESIYHPGYLLSDKERMKLAFKISSFDNMTVPKFWDPVDAFGEYEGGVREFLGNGGEYLVTPTEASAIGSFYDKKPTIFVAIASYRDPECSPTVESIFARAKHPERLRVAIIDQRTNEDPSCRPPSESLCRRSPDGDLCPYIGQIDYMEFASELMVGPVFARHLANRMYRGEYFAMQVDSHVRFTEDWDEDIVDQWNSAGNEMAVLTTYMTNLADKNYDSIRHKSRTLMRSIMCDYEYEWTGIMRHIKFNLQPQFSSKVEGSPQLHPFWAAGFSFGRGHFVVSIPYDHYLPFVFQGEEILQTIPGFTYGYDFYAPMRNVAFHMYAMNENKEARENIPKFTENEYFFGKEVKSHAYSRLIGISGTRDRPKDYFHLEEERYGLGQVRSREQFFDIVGIHPASESNEGGLCQFVRGWPRVEGSMHGLFLPFLRFDKMGIDYSRLTYRHKTPEGPKDSVVDEKQLAALQAQLSKLVPEANYTNSTKILD